MPSKIYRYGCEMCECVLRRPYVLLGVSLAMKMAHSKCGGTLYNRYLIYYLAYCKSGIMKIDISLKYAVYYLESSLDKNRVFIFDFHGMWPARAQPKHRKCAKTGK